jgi:hypothetical protein
MVILIENRIWILSFDNSCIDVVSNDGDGNCRQYRQLLQYNGDATCGDCLPIMEGDNAYINARLWVKTNDVTAGKYMGYYSDDFAPVYMSQSTWIYQVLCGNNTVSVS